MNRVYLVFLVTAGLVTILRFFTLTDLGYDLTYQIQPAQHFLEGKGFGGYVSKPGYLFEKDYVQLAHFPLGYSIYTAAVLALGIPLALVTKIFGAFCTMAGWAGWGMFYITAQTEWNPLPNRFQFGIGYLLAISLPLFATPVWDGTDIFLWASVPWILLCLAKGTLNESNSTKFYLMAGFLCGLCCLMRYASVAVVLLACFIIFLNNRNSLIQFCRISFFFFIGSSIPVLLQFYQLFFIAEKGSKPGGVGVVSSLELLWHRFLEAASMLPTLNWAILFWMPDRFLRLFLPNTGWAALQVVLLICIFFICLAAIFFYKTPRSNLRFSSLLSMGALLVVILPMVLFASQVFGVYSYVGDRRYYLPLVPLLIILFGLIAQINNQLFIGKYASFIRALFYLIFSAYTLIFAISVPMLFSDGPHGKVVLKKMTGESRLETFPHIGLNYEKSPARRMVMKILAENNDYKLFTSLDNWFSAEPNLSKDRVTRIPNCESLKGIKVSGPLRLLVFSIDGGAADDVLYELDGTGEIQVSTCLERIPNLRLIARFPASSGIDFPTKILEANIPAGLEFSY